jgi:hypothetical protein
MFPLCSKYGDVVGKKQALVELAEARSGLAFLSWIMVYPAGGAHVCGLPSPHSITFTTMPLVSCIWAYLIPANRSELRQVPGRRARMAVEAKAAAGAEGRHARPGRNAASATKVNARVPG